MPKSCRLTLPIVPIPASSSTPLQAIRSGSVRPEDSSNSSASSDDRSKTPRFFKASRQSSFRAGSSSCSIRSSTLPLSKSISKGSRFWLMTSAAEGGSPSTSSTRHRCSASSSGISIISERVRPLPIFLVMKPRSMSWRSVDSTSILDAPPAASVS